MAGQIVKAAGTEPEMLKQLLSFLLRYGLVVVLGLAIMVFLFYPALVALTIKKLSWKQFQSGMRDAQLTAFSTSSSVATLPVTMQCVHDRLGVSTRTSSFVLPIGATVNMDGTSMYQAIAVVHWPSSTWSTWPLASKPSLCSQHPRFHWGGSRSFGRFGPMIIVLESVGLNPAWIALIFPIDRILDMCRTVVNVTGDGAVSSFIAASEGELTPPSA